MQIPSRVFRVIRAMGAGRRARGVPAKPELPLLYDKEAMAFLKSGDPQVQRRAASPAPEPVEAPEPGAPGLRDDQIRLLVRAVQAGRAYNEAIAGLDQVIARSVVDAWRDEIHRRAFGAPQ